MASTQDTNATGPVGRKVRHLGIGVAIVLVLYTGGWFYGAHMLDGWLRQQVALLDKTSMSPFCDDLSVGGFPFLIGVTCSKTGIDDQDRGLAIQFGSLRTAARIYSPGMAVIEMDGPLAIDLQQQGLSLKGDWQSLRASGSAGLDGLHRASMEGKAITLAITDAFLQQNWNISLLHPEFHVRAHAKDLDVAVLVENLDIKDSAGSMLLPTVSASADMTLVGKAHVLSGQNYGSLESAGELRAFKIDLGNGTYGQLSGPFSIDAEGWVSGDMSMTLENLDGWEQSLTKAFPDAQSTISGMSELLRRLKKDKPSVTVKLAIVQGTITMSMIPIGHIPQL